MFQSAGPVVEAWEQGQGLSAARLALLLLQRACPQHLEARLRESTLGWRNHVLLRLQAREFSPRLECYAGCPHCGAELSFELNAGDLAGEEPAWQAAPHEMVRDGVRVTYRPLVSADLLAAEATGEAARAREVLASRCLLGVEGDGQAPYWLAAELPGLLSAADPLAELLITLECPACGKGWLQLLDPAVFLWRQLQARARQALVEVAALAHYTGWSEASLLGMSDFRRARYLELLPPGGTTRE
jgi:hypothetical protein